LADARKRITDWVVSSADKAAHEKLAGKVQNSATFATSSASSSKSNKWQNKGAKGGQSGSKKSFKDKKKFNKGQNKGGYKKQQADDNSHSSGSKRKMLDCGCSHPNRHTKDCSMIKAFNQSKDGSRPAKKARTFLTSKSEAAGVDGHNFSNGSRVVEISSESKGSDDDQNGILARSGSGRRG
jgi:hypothetical protein